MWDVVEDHPRSRGVYAMVKEAQTLFVGSSPLARGLRRPEVFDAMRRGIIPARAGFTEGPC